MSHSIVSVRNTVAILAFVFSFSIAQDILVNVVGYETNGAKRAVIQSTSGAITATTAELVNAQGTAIYTIDLATQTTVSGWAGRNFKVADFSEFKTRGKYRVKVGSKTSQEFSIGEKILQKETGAFQISFFKGMRNTDAGDRNLPIYDGGTHNIYGGWWDATGDPGKHLSHLSYANYFNPQQIPLVVWALLNAMELQPSTFTESAKAEAAWGADYLLRALSSADYFYMSVFDSWGGDYREICEWSGERGTRSSGYKSAMREGGGVSIAALARASTMNLSGDSSSAQYIAGAKRAYTHLKTNNINYLNDGKENIIDDYTGLLAATELYGATREQQYSTDAAARAASIINRQNEEGWFYTHNKSGANERAFYHAADEGLPIVALVRYVEICNPSDAQTIRAAIRKNLQWYKKITYEMPNPFEYAKMYGAPGAAANPGATDLARGGMATASREEANFPASNAFDGNASSRWSSYQDGANNDNQWITVDLGAVYKVDKVILNWENAYGKSYRIDVSTNGTSWATVATIANNTSGGTKEHSFAPVNAQYIRMFGVERGIQYGGFSLYSFEVYGEQLEEPSIPHNARFFMPHSNETGYWWQGENARLASLAAAFIMGASISAQSEEFLDSLYNMAYAQLNWILGKNPFGVTMMFGFGDKNYPNYPATRGLNNIKGGICNGITAKDANEADLEWKPYGDGEWQNWRWIEQWLPHNAWYLTAIASISHRIDNPAAIVPDTPPSPIKNKYANMELPTGEYEIDVYNLHGQKIFSYKVLVSAAPISLKMPQNMAKGAYLLSIKDAKGKNIAVKKVLW
jgi:hypothetical protein